MEFGIRTAIAIDFIFLIVFISGGGRLGPLGPGPSRIENNENTATVGGDANANFDGYFLELFFKMVWTHLASSNNKTIVARPQKGTCVQGYLDVQTSGRPHVQTSGRPAFGRPDAHPPFFLTIFAAAAAATAGAQPSGRSPAKQRTPPWRRRPQKLLKIFSK